MKTINKALAWTTMTLALAMVAASGYAQQKPSTQRPTLSRSNSASSNLNHFGANIWRGFVNNRQEWRGGHGWYTESRNYYGEFMGSPYAWGGSSSFYDGSFEAYGFPPAGVTLGQGINNYALPKPKLYCPNVGYYPAVATCPQEWLRLFPESGSR